MGKNALFVCAILTYLCIQCIGICRSESCSYLFTKENHQECTAVYELLRKVFLSNASNWQDIKKIETIKIDNKRIIHFVENDEDSCNLNNNLQKISQHINLSKKTISFIGSHANVYIFYSKNQKTAFALFEAPHRHHFQYLLFFIKDKKQFDDFLESLLKEKFNFFYEIEEKLSSLPFCEQTSKIHQRKCVLFPFIFLDENNGDWGILYPEDRLSTFWTFYRLEDDHFVAKKIEVFENDLSKECFFKGYKNLNLFIKTLSDIFGEPNSAKEGTLQIASKIKQTAFENLTNVKFRPWVAVHLNNINRQKQLDLQLNKLKKQSNEKVKNLINLLNKILPNVEIELENYYLNNFNFKNRKVYSIANINYTMLSFLRF